MRTNVIATFAGDGTGLYNGENVPALSAGLDPVALAIAPNGSLYVADETNRRVLRIYNGVVTTVAGNGQPYSGQVNGEVATADGVTPRGIALTTNRSLYITDPSAGVVKSDHARTHVEHASPVAKR